MITVRDVLLAMDRLTGGRMVTDLKDFSTARNPFVVMKDSGVPGKACIEIPGLVWGDPEMAVSRIGVTMTMTEATIELAHARGVQVIIAHHPVADAASSGGVPMGIYLPLYGIAVIECHEALHGLHPGIPWLHGHLPDRFDVAFGGVQGNVMIVGRPLPEVRCAGDIIRRLETLLDREQEYRVLGSERAARSSPSLDEAAAAVAPQIFVGDPGRPVHRVLHIFPHTGFSVANLEQALVEYPEIDTVICSISRVTPAHPLVHAARARGLTFLAGNTHALEILENGLPLAYALRELLPQTEVLIFRERVTAAPLEEVGGGAVQDYARQMAREHLIRGDRR